MYTSQAIAEVRYRVVGLHYNSSQIVVIRDTRHFKRLAGLGVVVVVSGIHHEEREKGIRFVMADENGGMIMCWVLLWCGRQVGLGAF